MRIERFEDIEAWQLSRILARKIYTLTRKEQSLLGVGPRVCLDARVSGRL